MIEKISSKNLFLLLFLFINLFFLPLNLAKAENRQETYKQLNLFGDVFQRVQEQYVEEVTDKKLIESAISGMLQSLDPHSSYLSADSYKDMQVKTKGKFGGLGIEVGMKDGFVEVITPIEDTPAFNAGLKSGDLIIKLDDTLVKGLTLNDAVKLMRGKPGTSIDIRVLREDVVDPIDIKITRAQIKTKSVKAKLIEPDYAYLRVTQFQDRTGEDLAKAIKKLRKENKHACNGIILDMRNNPGGLLTQAVSVSAAFLDDDELVVYTEGRAPDSKMRLTTAPENYIRPGGDFEKNNYIKSLPKDIKDVPMVVIINNGSASAAEIVTGALKDHKRATILGTRSFGKGSVQSILPMMNGSAIKLTTARYFTPNGTSIQGKGIEPDITVKDGTESLAYREEDIPDSLSNPQDKDKKDDKPVTNGPTPEQKEALKNFKPIKFGTDEDIQYV